MSSGSSCVIWSRAFRLSVPSLRVNSMMDSVSLFPESVLAVFKGRRSSVSLCVWLLNMPTTLSLSCLSPKVRLISSPRFMDDALASSSPMFASLQFFGAVPFRYAPLSLRKVLMSSTPLTKILWLLMFVVRLAVRIFWGSRCFM